MTKFNMIDGLIDRNVIFTIEGGKIKDVVEVLPLSILPQLLGRAKRPLKEKSQMTYGSEKQIQGVTHDEVNYCASRLRNVGYSTADNGFGDLHVSRAGRHIATLKVIDCHVASWEVTELVRRAN